MCNVGRCLYERMYKSRAVVICKGWINNHWLAWYIYIIPVGIYMIYGRMLHDSRLRSWKGEDVTQGFLKCDKWCFLRVLKKCGSPCYSTWVGDIFFPKKPLLVLLRFWKWENVKRKDIPGPHPTDEKVGGMDFFVDRSRSPPAAG